MPKLLTSAVEVPSLQELQCKLKPGVKSSISITESNHLQLVDLKTLRATGLMIPSDWNIEPIPDWETEGLDILNNFRVGMGLGTLQLLPTLVNAIEWKVCDCAFFEYLDHNTPAGAVPGSPDARTWSNRIAASGYVGACAENLAYGARSPQEAFDILISAGPGEGHYDNIVSAYVNAVGIGVARDPKSGLYFFGQTFGILPYSGPAPIITSISPTVGVVGTSVKINGANFGGLKNVVFNNNIRASNYSSILGQTINVVVPNGAITGAIIVEAQGGFTVSQQQFTIDNTPPPPPPSTDPDIKIGQHWKNVHTGKIVVVQAVTSSQVTWKRGTTVRTVSVKSFYSNFDIVT